MSETAIRLSWEYVGEELAIFWRSPYGHGKEKIASFWWPLHPEDKTAEVEQAFEAFAARLCVDHRGETPAPASIGTWQPIETAPKDTLALFWIEPIPSGESYTDTSGTPIFSDAPPRIHFGKRGTWSALSRATHWMPLPDPPALPGEGPASSVISQKNDDDHAR